MWHRVARIDGRRENEKIVEGDRRCLGAEGCVCCGFSCFDEVKITTLQGFELFVFKFGVKALSYLCCDFTT